MFENKHFSFSCPLFSDVRWCPSVSQNADGSSVSELIVFSLTGHGVLYRVTATPAELSDKKLKGRGSAKNNDRLEGEADRVMHQDIS